MIKFLYITLLAYIFTWSKNRLECQNITMDMVSNAKEPLDILLAQKERTIWLETAKAAAHRGLNK